jgi:hypothetical protein
MADFSRLTANWHRCGPWMGDGEIIATNNCDDCRILFRTHDYSIHLREEASWWLVDTVNDRGQRNNAVAKFSTFDLTEKYLIWRWSSIARGISAAPRVGPDLYSRGFSPDVTVIPMAEGIAELQPPSGKAILLQPDATIFSHLMLKSVDEIEQLIRTGRQ